MEQQLVQCLKATLAADNQVRSQAEQQLESFRSPQNDPQGHLGVILAKLLLDQSLALHIRQSAGLALRKFITTRWSPYFDAFLGVPSADVDVKDQIRSLLLQGLSDSQRKIRLTVSYAISTIAGPDYPDQYPQLLPCIQQLLQQPNSDGIHGAMRLLSEFVKVEMDEIQLIQVAKDILPTLETVLADQVNFSPHIRARCILVFRQCLTTLFMVKQSFPDVVKQASTTLLPRWLAAMEALLSTDAAQELHANSRGWESLSLRNEIFKTLKVAALFRIQFKPHLENLIKLAISNLASLATTFSQVYLSSDSDITPPQPEEGDQDVSADIPCLASSIFDFIAEASRGDRCRSIFLSGGSGGEGTESDLLSQLVSFLLVYVDMTTEDEDNWANDANAFIADEDDETLAYSLRIATADLLGTLIEDFPAPTLRCLGRALEKRVQEGQESKSRREDDWWKAAEGVLTAIGNNADAITEILDSQAGAARQHPLNIESIFTNIVLPNVGDDAPPFLQGRGFVFASQFATALPSELAVQFLEAVVRAIESPSATMPVKISAVRTVKNFFRHLSTQLVSPFAPRIVRQLGPLLTQASEDALVLVMETIQAVVIQDQQTASAVTAPIVELQVIGEIVQAVLQVWASNASDVILLSVVSDLLESLAASKQQGVSGLVVQKSVPFLAAAIGSNLQQQNDEPSAVAETAIELSKSVLDGADSLALRGVVQVLCPNLVKVLKTSADQDVLHNGIACLTVLVKKCPQQLLEWREPGADAPSSSIESILEIVARQLDPTQASEGGGLAIGDLVIALLREAADQIGPVLPQLVDAMVQRLATAQTATFSQSLILPIAYLMHDNDDQARQVMDLLESTHIGPSENGESGTGLEMLGKKWVENAETFQGFWAQRIGVLGLCKLVQSNRPLLTQTTVKGDLVPDNSNIIRTRSRAKTMPHQYTQIPLSAKIVKLLIKEWAQSSQGPAGGGKTNDGARTPETDEDGEWDDEEGLNDLLKKKEFSFLSDMLGPGGLDSINDDDFFDTDDDEEEYKSDPVYQMDFKDYLSTFLKTFSKTMNPSISSCLLSNLTNEETRLLQALL